MMTVSASISKTFIILVLFFFFLVIMPSSMAELEKTVKKTGAEIGYGTLDPNPVKPYHPGKPYGALDPNHPAVKPYHPGKPYGALDPNHPAVKPSHPGKPYERRCRSLYNCRVPSHKASPRLQ